MAEGYVSKEHFEEFRKLMDQRFDQAAKLADLREVFAKQHRADLRQFLEQRQRAKEVRAWLKWSTSAWHNSRHTRSR